MLIGRTSCFNSGLVLRGIHCPPFVLPRHPQPVVLPSRFAKPHSANQAVGFFLGRMHDLSNMTCNWSACGAAVHTGERQLQRAFCEMLLQLLGVHPSSEQPRSAFVRKLGSNANSVSLQRKASRKYGTKQSYGYHICGVSTKGHLAKEAMPQRSNVGWRCSKLHTTSTRQFFRNTWPG